MPKKKAQTEEIDNKWEFGAFAIRNWWKIIFIILVAGLVVSGFTIQCGKNTIHKDPIKLKAPAQVGEK